MSLTMSREEREAFLADVHVAMIAVEEPGRGPLLAPIWYGYQPGGEVWIVTDRDSRKGRLLERARRFSLCVQTETPPYRYASVEGPVTAIADSDVERDVRLLARRYLGRELGDRYVEATRGEASQGGTIRVSMRPERWLTTDYAKQFRDGG